ncbi:MAG: phosphatase PAP2 family protein [Bacteroidales bacterium]|nr:phosphatase PAP2 family protein [Bacteroidales bacterium]
MRTKILILLFIFPAFSLTSQDTLQYNFLHKTLVNHGKIWESTVQFGQYNYKKLIPLALLTGTSLYFDEEISKQVVSFTEKNKLERYSHTVTQFGDPYILGGTLLLSYGSGWLFRDQKLRQTAVMATEAYIHNGIFTYLGKLAFARQRPFVNGKDRWHFFPYSLQGHSPSNTAYQSFPSGHTSGVFAVATVFARQYQNTTWVPVLAYSIATLTGISRVTEHKHWLGDVIAGAALGYGIGNFVYLNSKDTRYTLFPTYWDNNVSLTFQLEF